MSLELNFSSLFIDDVLEYKNKMDKQLLMIQDIFGGQLVEVDEFPWEVNHEQNANA